MTVKFIKKQDSPTPILSQLIVDKLSITFEVGNDAKKRVVEGIRELEGIGKKDEATAVNPTRNYWYSIKLPGNEHFAFDGSGRTTIFLEAQPKKSNINRFCRIDFSPSHVSLDDVDALLNENFGISYWHDVVSGIVTRIDFAVDLTNVIVSEMYIWAKRYKVTDTKVSKGKTLYIGAASSACHFAIYDKPAQIKKQNQKAKLTALKCPVPALPTTRIEAKLLPDVPLKQFAEAFKSKNPFASLAVGYFGYYKIGAEHDLFNLFLMAGRVYGLNAVRSVLSKKAKSALNDLLLAKGKSEWWNPAELWAQMPEKMIGLIQGIPAEKV